MITRERAYQLRSLIEQAAQLLDDTKALSGLELFAPWGAGNDYATGDRVRYDGVLYRCLIAHTSQADWTPVAAVSLWARVLIPDPETIYEWVQPDSTNLYMKGDKVTHNGKTWVSTIDNNNWEPGVFGWEETDG